MSCDAATQTENEKMNFLVSSDRNYLKYLRVLMASVYENHKRTKCDFFVLHSELNKDDFDYVKEISKQYDQTVYFLKVDKEAFSKFPFTDRFPQACLYILLAHKYLPQNIERILYLDIDTIVNGDLTEFYNLDFENNFLIATKELFNAKDEPADDLNKFDSITETEISKAAQGKYFNSGVLLFNIDLFREENIDVNFYVNNIKNQQDVFFDQGILNICFATRTKLLTSCKYNYRISYSAKDYFKRSNFIYNEKIEYSFYPIDAKIVHYCGYIMNFKPWYLHFTKFELQKSPDYFFDLIPECGDFLDLWWKYAKLVPDYQLLYDEQKINKAAYRMLYLSTIKQNLLFLNAIGVDSLTVPTYRQKNTIFSNEDLNMFLKPRVYRCADNSIKATIKNLPKEFVEQCGFRLTVKNIAANSPNGNAVLQILEPNSQNATVYRRHLSSRNATWGPWYKSANTDDIEEIENSITEVNNNYINLLEQEKRNTKLLNEKILQLDKQIQCNEKLIKENHEQLQSVLNSISFKIGRFITYLPRMIKNIFKKSPPPKKASIISHNKAHAFVAFLHHILYDAVFTHHLRPYSI